MTKIYHPETRVAAAGVGKDSEYRAIVPPLYLSANYAWTSPLIKPSFDYARSGNPSREALEAALGALEGADHCVVTATGMAAIDLVLCLLAPDDLIVAPHDCYGGTHRLLTARAAKGQFKLKFIDQSDPLALVEIFAKKPKLLLIETPSNPLLRITDIGQCVGLAKAAGTITVADNTFLSPALQNPLALGCDIVLHSTTKFINGHSDIVGGAVMTNDSALGEALAWWANCTGITGAAFDSYQTLRGLRTLYPRIKYQQETTAELVEALQACKNVEKIYYPGLTSHRGHEIAARQQRGFGSMVSVAFEEHVDVVALLKNLRLFTIAESLGGFESLACLPATMTHGAMPAEARAVAGISDRLVRFSIGLEHVDDLTRDLFAAIAIAIDKKIKPDLDQSPCMGLAGESNPSPAQERVSPWV